MPGPTSTTDPPPERSWRGRPVPGPLQPPPSPMIEAWTLDSMPRRVDPRAFRLADEAPDRLAERPWAWTRRLPVPADGPPDLRACSPGHASGAGRLDQGRDDPEGRVEVDPVRLGEEGSCDHVSDEGRAERLT